MKLIQGHGPTHGGTGVYLELLGRFGRFLVFNYSDHVFVLSGAWVEFGVQDVHGWDFEFDAETVSDLVFFGFDDFWEKKLAMCVF